MADSVYTFLNGLNTFTGNSTISGLLLYVVVLMLILVFMRRAKGRFFFIALPVTMIMSAIGILQTGVMYLMLVLNVIGVIAQYRRLRN